ncbi:MAG TPA: AMP-binding protein, partial [bacterium]|nr:AMP-binding protein [bacterium]
MSESSSIENVFREERSFEPAPPEGLELRFKDLADYRRAYEESIRDPEAFWEKIAEGFSWSKKWDRVLRYDWKKEFQVAWFEGGQTNLSVNALDRHLKEKADKVALIWEGNKPGETLQLTFAELHREVGRLANALKAVGVRKGDRVAVYMGMVPELAMTLLACARIGAIHNVIFGGFSVDSLKNRILDCQASFLVTADGLFRGDKTVPLKAVADKAWEACEAEGHKPIACLVLQRTGEAVEMEDGRDYWWHEWVPRQDEHCEPEAMDAEDPLFILYTSGSTGKPKGVVHTTAGYMVQAAATFKYVFDYREEDI